MGILKEGGYGIFFTTQAAKLELEDIAGRKKEILYSLTNSFISYCEILVEFCYHPFWYNEEYTFMEVAAYAPIYLFEELAIREKGNGSMEQRLYIIFLKKNLGIDFTRSREEMDQMYVIDSKVHSSFGTFWRTLSIAMITSRLHEELVKELYEQYVSLGEDFLRLEVSSIGIGELRKDNKFLKKHIFRIV